jgi:pyruvate/2-oxoglutarate dehydrogenase complex dihydrolipoamide acyltransferase (E2) component
VSSSHTDATTLIDVTMPQMGVSVVEGTVVEWKKQPGDWVQADEIIASISTDKIDTDVEAPATGRVQELIVDVGTTVDVGTVLARIATDARPGEPHVSEGEEAAAAADEPQPEAPARESRGPRRYSPVVMRIASEHGIDLDRVEGTGRGGRVRKQDVLAFLDDGGGGAEPPMHIESPYRPDEPAPAKTRKPRFDTQPASPAGTGAPAATGSAPLSRMRQAIGARMLQSLQTAATCTTIVEVDLVRIEAARAKSGLTYLPYIARATIDTLREFPALNATLEDSVLTTYEGVHLGIAVSLGHTQPTSSAGTGGGLIVPVIHDAQELSVEGLASRIKDLARRGRANELTPDEVRGGSFTITNPGGYGSIIATPVINQPQVAILDTEAVVKRPVVVTDELGNDSIAIRPMTYLCMSWDHRALDGALAAQFLSELRKKLESWPTT